MQVKTLNEEKRLEVLVDRDLKGFNAEDLEKAVELALMCTKSQPTVRPKMSEVMKVLEGITGHPGSLEDVAAGKGSNEIEGRTCSFSRNYSADVHEGSSFTIEAMELSGPR